MNQWIDIKKAVPPDNREVLILYHLEDYGNHQRISIASRKILKNGSIKWRGYTVGGSLITEYEGCKNFYIITHWMNLPEMPE